MTINKKVFVALALLITIAMSLSLSTADVKPYANCIKNIGLPGCEEGSP